MTRSNTPLRRRRQGRPNVPRDEQKSELVTFRATPAMLAQLRESGRRHDRPLSHDIFHRLEISLRVFPDDNPQFLLAPPLLQALLAGVVVPRVAAPPRQEYIGATPAAEPPAPEGATGVAISDPGGPAAPAIVPSGDGPQLFGVPLSAEGLGSLAAIGATVSAGEDQQLSGGNSPSLVEILRDALAAAVREAVRESLPELVAATVREIESGKGSSQKTRGPDVIST